MATQVQIERELEWEAEAVIDGSQRAYKQELKLLDKGRGATTKAGSRLIFNVAASVQQKYEEVMAKAKTTPGPRAAATFLTANMPSEKVAAIVSRIIVDRCTRECSFAAVAVSIGEALEMEEECTVLEHNNSSLYRAVARSFKKRDKGDRMWIRKDMIRRARLKDGKVPFVAWSKKEKFQVGALMIQVYESATGLITTDNTKTAGKQVIKMIRPTKEMAEWIRTATDEYAMHAPVFRPMLVPPKDWTGLKDGGYLSPKLEYSLVKPKCKEQYEALKAANMPRVFQAVNVVQKTAWRVSTKMLDMVKLIRDSNLGVADIPPANNKPEMQVPEDFGTWVKEEQANWFAEAEQVKVTNRSWDGRRVGLDRILSTAETLLDNPIYYPVRMDFRSRLYTQPTGLSYQGSDMAKSLLEFNEGKPLGDAGVRWLAIHLANMFGEDKITMDDRVKWTEANSDKIIACVRDPLGYLLWTEADKPLQFLRACLEWDEYKKQGPGMISHLPVTVDGSCNGLQHLAALARCEQVGRDVNLLPATLPADIYRKVADRVVQFLNQDAKSMGAVAYWAQGWLQLGISRKTVKRCVMIVPYSGTFQAVREYLKQWFFETIVNEGVAKPWKNRECLDAIRYLAQLTWKAIGEVMEKPREVMEYIKNVASAVIDLKQVPAWPTPLGFPVFNDYRNMRHYIVETYSFGKRFQTTLTKSTKKRNTRKIKQAIAPNFVHSMDATCLQETVCRLSEQGIESFMIIHDSFGTHAAEMDRMQRVIREVFVDIYKNDNLTLLPRVGITPVKFGTLDVTQVLYSQYFFA